MSDENPIEIREAFNRFDKDGNDLIDLIEFRELLDTIEANMERAEAEAVFDAIDKDEDGLVDFEEFSRWWATVDRS
jgi:calmodulin